MWGILTRFHSCEFRVKKHSGAQSRKDGERRKAALLAQQKTLGAKRQRVIEFALDGTITTQDRDRRLKIVDADLESIRREFGELAAADTSMPTYAEWRRIWKPFVRGFADLPADEKRKLISSRFEQI